MLPVPHLVLIQAGFYCINSLLLPSIGKSYSFFQVIQFFCANHSSTKIAIRKFTYLQKIFQRQRNHFKFYLSNDKNIYLPTVHTSNILFQLGHNHTTNQSCLVNEFPNQNTVWLLSCIMFWTTSVQLFGIKDQRRPTRTVRSSLEERDSLLSSLSLEL